MFLAMISSLTTLPLKKHVKTKTTSKYAFLDRFMVDKQALNFLGAQFSLLLKGKTDGFEFLRDSKEGPAYASSIKSTFTLALFMIVNRL